jgi:hypothetical protein
MMTSEYEGSPFPHPRSHPWTDALSNSAHRYYDFKRTPALIRTSLEDFLPWGQYPATEQVYRLLEWLNGLTSPFESNDCEFTGPHANDYVAIAKTQQCSGRVMLLFRALRRNTVSGEIERLTEVLHRELSQLDPEFDCGLLGTTRVPVRYLELPNTQEQQWGMQLMLSFWAWGDSEAETMHNLGRLVGNLHAGLSSIAGGSWVTPATP